MDTFNEEVRRLESIIVDTFSPNKIDFIAKKNLARLLVHRLLYAKSEDGIRSIIAEDELASRSLLAAIQLKLCQSNEQLQTVASSARLVSFLRICHFCKQAVDALPNDEA